MAKNLILWVVIALVLMSVFNNFGQRRATPHEVDYSQFMADVKNGRVQKVVIEDRHIQGLMQNSDHFSTRTILFNDVKDCVLRGWSVKEWQGSSSAGFLTPLAHTRF